jgi:hypothetical protein
MVTLQELITEIFTRYKTYMLVSITNIGEILLSPYSKKIDFSKLQPSSIKVFHMDIDVELTQWAVSSSIENGVLCSYSSIEEVVTDLEEIWRNQCN